MKRMNVRFEEKNRRIPPAPRVVVPDTGVNAGRGQSKNFDSGNIKVRMGTENNEAGSWNYAFGPPPPGVDPEFDRRVASELARTREAKEGGRGEGGDRLINSTREMMRDEREENQEWSRKYMDSQLGDVNELRELSNNIPEKMKFEHDVAVALKQMEANGLMLQHELRHEQQQSESMSPNANLDSIPLMHLGARHSTEDQNQLGSDILSKSNPDPPQVYGKTHHVDDGLPDVYTRVGKNTNPATYSCRRRSGGLSSMWQGEEGSALQRGEAIEKQKKYRHELQQQIQERQHNQQHEEQQQQQHWSLEHQHAATSIPYIGGGVDDRNVKMSFGYNSWDGKSDHHLTNRYSQPCSSPLGVHASPGRLPSKTGLVSSMSQPWQQQPMMVESDTRHPQTIATVSNNRSLNNLPSHASPLMSVNCSATVEERARMKGEYAEELRKQIAENNERKASQLREEEATLVKEMQWEKYGDVVNEAASRHRGCEEPSGTSAPFHDIGSRNRLRKEMGGEGEEVPRQQVVDSAGLTMSSSLTTPSSNPSAFVIENGSSHPGSGIGLSARQRLMEDVYGTAAGLSIQLRGMQGKESGTEEVEKARKKCIALEQRHALEEQIEAKRRAREENEARKRHEEEAEQRRMMQEQIAYDNEQQAIRDKQLTEEQLRLEQLYEQQRQTLLKKMPTRHTSEVASNSSTRDPVAPQPMHHQSESCSNNRTEGADVPPHRTTLVPEAEAVNGNLASAIPPSSVVGQGEAQEARTRDDDCIVRKTKSSTADVNLYSLTGSAELPPRLNDPSSSSPCFESSGSITSSPPHTLHNGNNMLKQQQTGMRQQQLWSQQLDHLDLSRPHSDEDTIEQSLAGLSRFVAVDSPSYIDGQQDGGGDLFGDSLLMYLSAQQLELEKAEELEREKRMSKEATTSPPHATPNQLKDKQQVQQFGGPNQVAAEVVNKEFLAHPIDEADGVEENVSPLSTNIPQEVSVMFH